MARESLEEVFTKTVRFRCDFPDCKDGREGRDYSATTMEEHMANHFVALRPQLKEFIHQYPCSCGQHFATQYHFTVHLYQNRKERHFPLEVRAQWCNKDFLDAQYHFHSRFYPLYVAHVPFPKNLKLYPDFPIPNRVVNNEDNDEFERSRRCSTPGYATPGSFNMSRQGSPAPRSRHSSHSRGHSPFPTRGVTPTRAATPSSSHHQGRWDQDSSRHNSHSDNHRSRHDEYNRNEKHRENSNRRSSPRENYHSDYQPIIDPYVAPPPPQPPQPPCATSEFVQQAHGPFSSLSKINTKKRKAPSPPADPSNRSSRSNYHSNASGLSEPHLDSNRKRTKDHIDHNNLSFPQMSDIYNNLESMPDSTAPAPETSHGEHPEPKDTSPELNHLGLSLEKPDVDATSHTAEEFVTERTLPEPNEQQEILLRQNSRSSYMPLRSNTQQHSVRAANLTVADEMKISNFRPKSGRPELPKMVANPPFMDVVPNQGSRERSRSRTPNPSGRARSRSSSRGPSTRKSSARNEKRQSRSYARHGLKNT